MVGPRSQSAPRRRPPLPSPSGGGIRRNAPPQPTKQPPPRSAPHAVLEKSELSLEEDQLRAELQRINAGLQSRAASARQREVQALRQQVARGEGARAAALGGMGGGYGGQTGGMHPPQPQAWGGGGVQPQYQQYQQHQQHHQHHHVQQGSMQQHQWGGMPSWGGVPSAAYQYPHTSPAQHAGQYSDYSGAPPPLGGGYGYSGGAPAARGWHDPTAGMQGGAQQVPAGRRASPASLHEAVHAVQRAGVAGGGQGQWYLPTPPAELQGWPANARGYSGYPTSHSAQHAPTAGQGGAVGQPWGEQHAPATAWDGHQHMGVSSSAAASVGSVASAPVVRGGAQGQQGGGRPLSAMRSRGITSAAGSLPSKRSRGPVSVRTGGLRGGQQGGGGGVRLGSAAQRLFN